MSSHISTLVLNAYRYGELEPDERSGVTQHLDACERCRSRYQAQVASRAAFELMPLPEALSAPPAPWWRGVVRVLLPAGGLLALAVAAMLVLVVPADEPYVGIKGSEDQGIEVWVDGPDGARALPAGEGVAPGTRLQLGYQVDSAWVSFAGRDATGAVEVYGSFEAQQGHGLSGFALELDGSPGDQEFFVVESERELTDAEAREAVLAGGADVHRVAVPKRR